MGILTIADGLAVSITVSCASGHQRRDIPEHIPSATFVCPTCQRSLPRKVLADALYRVASQAEELKDWKIDAQRYHAEVTMEHDSVTIELTTTKYEHTTIKTRHHS